MGSPLDVIASDYVAKYGEPVRSRSRLRELYDSYIWRQESTLLDTVAATTAINATFFSDQIDPDAVTSQMKDAFARAYPGQDLMERLEALRGLEPDSPQVQGFVSNWKGVYHEFLVQHRLNDGYQVGSVVLGEGQTAVLAEKLNEPGVDLRILNADGTEDVALQVKATNEIGYIRDALERYPDIQIATTDEVAQQIADERVFSSGFSDEDLKRQIAAPMEEVWDGPVEEFIEDVLPFLPFVIIGATEVTKVLMRRQSFQRAMYRAVQRGVKTGAAMGVGAVTVFAGVPMFSLPATVLTRLGIDRYQVSTRLGKKIEKDRAQLVPLVAKS